MQSLIKIFGCGGIYNQTISGNVQDFIVTKFSDITDKIIPFFEANPLQGAKSKEFANFKEVAELMKEGAHLTYSGLSLIKQIKSRMNKNID